MKTREKIGWTIVKIILIILKVLFNKPMGFFVNFIVFMLPVAFKIDFSIKPNNLSLVLFSLVVYPIFFELMYRCYAKKKVKMVHELIDKIIHGINTNFE